MTLVASKALSLWSFHDNGTDVAGWVLLHVGNADKLECK